MTNHAAGGIKGTGALYRLSPCHCTVHVLYKWEAFEDDGDDDDNDDDDGVDDDENDEDTVL